MQPYYTYLRKCIQIVFHMCGLQPPAEGKYATLANYLDKFLPFS